MAKSKKIVKKISIALLTGVGVIAGVLGAKKIFNPNKPKVDEDLAKLVESLENKILIDLEDNGKYYVSHDAKAYFSHVNNNAINPIIGEGKYTIDFYGVLVDHGGSFNFKTEYELPTQIKNQLDNAGDEFYKILNNEINNLVLTSIEMNRILEIDEQFQKPEIATKFLKYIGKTNDPKSTEKTESSDYIPLLFEQPTIEKVYTKEPVVIPPETIHDEVIVVDEGEFHYVSRFKVVGVESQRDSKNNVINSYIREQEFEVKLNENQTPEDVVKMLYNEITNNTKNFETQNTYTSQKIENYNRMKDLMRHSYNHHHPDNPVSKEKNTNEREM